MNIITTQAYTCTCRINTPQPEGCSHLNSVGIYTYFILIRVTLSLMIKGFNNILAAKLIILFELRQKFYTFFEWALIFPAPHDSQ